MGVFARLVAVTAMLGLVACAAIAGLESPADEEPSTTPPDRPTPTATNSSTPSPEEPPSDSGSTPIEDATSTKDAETKDADAAPPPPCTKTPIGQSCEINEACCSNKCNEAKICANECRGLGSTCEPFATAPCCVGYYCSGFLCAPCIGSGGTAADNGIGGKNAKSCCSRQLDGTLCK